MACSIVAGRVLVTDARKLTTAKAIGVQNINIKVDPKKGGVIIGNATIIKAGIVASNASST